MREKFLTIAIFSFFAVIVLCLFYTQILRYPYYERLAKSNAIRIIPIDGPRGNIYDRNGEILVTSRLSFNVAVVYQELESIQKLLKVLTQTLGITEDDVLNALEKARSRPYAPVTIVQDIDKSKAMILEEASVDVRGLVIETRSRRNYVYGYVGSHLFGYLSEITDDELDRMRDYGYRMRDLVGRGGLEKQYDKYLMGTDGGLQIEVDSRGRQIRTLGLKEPSCGKDLYLTIDKSLQIASDKLLGDRKGAVVAMDPKTGEVLALASHPAFDPNIFVRPDTSEQRVRLLTDKVGKPLVNRAISGVYPPGSVFKIVTSSAALDTNRISQYTTFTCNGSYSLGRAQFDCWKKEGHGPQEITEGLMHSCNVFFYNIGRLAGPDNIENYSKLYGYGAKTGIDLPGEKKGVVPGKSWKRLKNKGIWYEGDTLNYSIGQGYLLVTPLQVAEMMSVVANGGYIVKPYIAKKIDQDEVADTYCKKINVKASVIQKIREGLYKVVNGETGTGRYARMDGVKVAGKTGTAQNPQGRTHAWFTGYAPFDNPKICLVVFLEHGGHGGVGPAQIAKGIFEEAKRKGYL